MSAARRKSGTPERRLAVTPLDLLLPYQRAWVQDSARFKIWLKSRQIGGSLAAAFEVVADAIETGGEPAGEEGEGEVGFHSRVGMPAAPETAVRGGRRMVFLGDGNRGGLDRKLARMAVNQARGQWRAAGGFSPQCARRDAKAVVCYHFGQRSYGELQNCRPKVSSIPEQPGVEPHRAKPGCRCPRPLLLRSDRPELPRHPPRDRPSDRSF